MKSMQEQAPAALGIIRCAVCGRDIQPGDLVALYALENPLMFEWATTVSMACGAAAIGCLRQDCCGIAGGAYAGSWTGHTFERAFDTDVSRILFLATGQTVVG